MRSTQRATISFGVTPDILAPNRSRLRRHTRAPGKSHPRRRNEAQAAALHECEGALPRRTIHEVSGGRQPRIAEGAGNRPKRAPSQRPPIANARAPNLCDPLMPAGKDAPVLDGLKAFPAPEA